MWWQHKGTGIRQFAAAGSDVERRLQKLTHLWEPAQDAPVAVAPTAPAASSEEGATLSNAVPAADLRKLSKSQLRQLAARLGLEDGFQTKGSLVEAIEQYVQVQQAAQAAAEGAPTGAEAGSEEGTSGDAGAAAGVNDAEGAPATAEGNEGDGADGADGTNAE
jgi:hypothetical protein